MGIRPTLYMVVGIDDAVQNDPRHDENKFPEIEFDNVLVENIIIDGAPICEYLYTEKRKPKQPIYLYDVIYNERGDSEYRVENVVGYILDELPYAADIVYELIQMICNDDPEKFQDHGYIVRGNHPSRIQALSNPHSLYRRCDGNEPYDLAIKENRLICFENPFTTSLWFDIAIELMKQAGWTVTREMLKIMIVWNWS